MTYKGANQNVLFSTRKMVGMRLRTKERVRNSKKEEAGVKIPILGIF